LAGASSAVAAAPAPCHAGGTLDETLAAVAAQPSRWICGPAHQSLTHERAFVRFAVPADEEHPRYLEARRAALAGIHVRVLARDGEVRLASYGPEDLQPSQRGGYFRIPLPATATAPREVIAAIDLPTHAMTLEQAYLAPANAHDGAADRRLLLLLAALCGMLLMPLMFNAAFYRILRERFVLWHSALALTLMLSIVAGSGLALYFTILPVMTLSWTNTLLFGLSVGAAGMFAHSF